MAKHIIAVILFLLVVTTAAGQNPARPIIKLTSGLETEEDKISEEDVFTRRWDREVRYLKHELKRPNEEMYQIWSSQRELVLSSQWWKDTEEDGIDAFKDSGRKVLEWKLKNSNFAEDTEMWWGALRYDAKRFLGRKFGWLFPKFRIYYYGPEGIEEDEELAFEVTFGGSDEESDEEEESKIDLFNFGPKWYIDRLDDPVWILRIGIPTGNGHGKVYINEFEGHLARKNVVWYLNVQDEHLNGKQGDKQKYEWDTFFRSKAEYDIKDQELSLAIQEIRPLWRIIPENLFMQAKLGYSFKEDDWFGGFQFSWTFGGENIKRLPSVPYL